ncbi:MAG: hypothetical protein OXB86_03115 [Bdellovibrionales bacterium]|nr:hypothetical protein [Bdellovibrionales bacterium]
MYHTLSLIVLLSLVACVNSDPPDSPRTRSGNSLIRSPRQQQTVNPETANPADPTQPEQNLDISRITFPLQVVKREGTIPMSIHTTENNTKVHVETPLDDQVLNILAGFDGQVTLENPKQIILSAGHLKLIFDLGKEVSLKSDPNTPVTRGDILASTTGSITLSLKKNGNLIPFCLNIINQSEGLVDVHIVNDQGECET